MAKLGIGVISESKNSLRIRSVNSGYEHEKLEKNRYEAGTLKMGMGRVRV